MSNQAPEAHTYSHTQQHSAHVSDCQHRERDVVNHTGQQRREERALESGRRTSISSAEKKHVMCKTHHVMAKALHLLAEIHYHCIEYETSACYPETNRSRPVAASVSCQSYCVFQIQDHIFQRFCTLLHVASMTLHTRRFTQKKKSFEELNLFVSWNSIRRPDSKTFMK